MSDKLDLSSYDTPDTEWRYKSRVAHAEAARDKAWNEYSAAVDLLVFLKQNPPDVVRARKFERILDWMHGRRDKK